MNVGEVWTLSYESYYESCVIRGDGVWAPGPSELRAEAERLEHGRRKKPRSYRWTVNDDGSYCLRDTRHGDGEWVVYRLRRLAPPAP